MRLQTVGIVNYSYGSYNYYNGDCLSKGDKERRVN